MGTPDFAASSLASLVEGGYNVVGAVTQTDKPKGRGNKLSSPPVKLYAESHGIPVYQPKTLRGDEFASLLRSIDPKLIVVTAYGKILPPNVLEYPEYGCVNVHGSLLPEYRGAAPIQRAIIEGKTETGITTMLMDDGIDTGMTLLSESTPISDADDFETLHDRLAEIGARLLPKTVDGVVSGSIIPQKQDDSRASYAAKLTNDDCELDFNRPVREIFNRIRGLSPYPLAFSHLNGRLIKFTSAKIEDNSPGSDETSAKPGEIVSLDGALGIRCSDGVIGVTGVVPEGKARMTARDFINGRKASVGDILGRTE